MQASIIDIVLEASRAGYAVVDRDYRLIQWGGEISGSEVTTLQPGDSLFRMLPELLGCDSILAALLNGELDRYDLDHLQRDNAAGNRFYLSLSIVPYIDDEQARLLVIARDTSIQGRVDQQVVQQRNELKLLRDRLSQQNALLKASNAELQSLNVTRSMLVTLAVNELRNPLTSIVGYLDLLLQGEYGQLSAEQRDALLRTQAQSRRLERSTLDLLDIVRFDAGRIELLLQPVDLQSLIELVVAGQRPLLEARTQRLSIQAPGDLPMALCDEARTLQIVGNLISRISQKTAVGGEIRITLNEANEEGYLQLEFADSATQPHRLAEEPAILPARMENGDLGLTLTRSLVELHSGRLWFGQQHDYGQNIYITFPAAV